MENNVAKSKVMRLRKAILMRGLFQEVATIRIKQAFTIDEYLEAFRLVHQEYVRAGYIKSPMKSGIFFNIHSILPWSTVLIMTHLGKVVSTLSLVKDSPNFGLPMDSVYSSELDSLRKEGRILFEACGLATSKKFRWKNIFMLTFREAYWHAIRNDATDICIMVNPKHVTFYKTILLFEELGEEKFYDRLGVPAVALRIDLQNIEEKIKEAYAGFEENCNLYAFLYGKSPHYTEKILEMTNGLVLKDPRGGTLPCILRKK